MTGYAYPSRPGVGGKFRLRAMAVDPASAWRALTDAVEALDGDVEGVGVGTAVADAVRGVAKLRLPVEGEDAASAGRALADLAGTWPLSARNEDRRGWRVVTLTAAAKEVSILLDQAADARAASARRMSGED